MTKILILLLALFIVTGCDNDTENYQPNNQNNNQQENQEPEQPRYTDPYGVWTSLYIWGIGEHPDPCEDPSSTTTIYENGDIVYRRYWWHGWSENNPHTGEETQDGFLLDYRSNPLTINQNDLWRLTDDFRVIAVQNPPAGDNFNYSFFSDDFTRKYMMPRSISSIYTWGVAPVLSHIRCP